MKLKLGDLLVREGLITAQQLQSALDHQRRHPGHRKIGETILALKLTTEEQMLQVLSKALGIQAIDLRRIEPPGQEALRAIDVKLAEKEILFPVRLEVQGARRRLVVAMADPTNLRAIDALQFKLGFPVVPFLSTISQIRACIQKFYRHELSNLDMEDSLEMSRGEEVSRIEVIQRGSVREMATRPSAEKTDVGSVVINVAELRVFSGPQKGQIYPIPARGQVVFGRGEVAQVVVIDQRMSRQHFEVAHKPEGLVVTDLKSSNGTFVNKKQIQTAVLAQGDWVQAGNTLFQVQLLNG